MPDPALRLCIDRVVPEAYHPTAAARALTENPANRIAVPIDVDVPVDVGPDRIAIVVGKKWQKGRTLKVRFLDGSSTQTKKVEDRAHQWEQYANIKFIFGDAQDAEIRISFVADDGSWSAVGTDALIEQAFPRYQPTMNFGWLRDNTDDIEYSRVVLHEFGHALGAIHEHQQPAAHLKWNKPEVYRAFEGPPNFWSKASIDHNIFDRYSKTQTNYTKFDPDSIMLYAFPANFFLGGHGTKSNTALSAQDKTFIGTMYRKP